MLVLLPVPKIQSFSCVRWLYYAMYRGPQSKKMREDTTRHQMYVNDVTEVPVTSTEEAYEQLLKGKDISGVVARNLLSSFVIRVAGKTRWC